MKSSKESIQKKLIYHADNNPEKIAIYDISKKDQLQTIDYGTFVTQAHGLAEHLIEQGSQGERLLICMEPGIDYVIALFGCFFANAIAVPVMAPPSKPFAEELDHIATNAGISAVLSSDSVVNRLIRLGVINDTQKTTDTKDLHTSQKKPLKNDKRDIGHIPWLITSNFYNKLTEFHFSNNVTDDQVLLLQYTSGSTSHPKGVMVTSGALASNIQMINKTFPIEQDDKLISWLPPYHDMGLVGHILNPLYTGRAVILMSPIEFIKHPVKYLKGIDQYRPRLTTMPNFGYKYLLGKTPQDKLSSLDLSSIKYWLCGAEPIQSEVLDKFVKYFSTCSVKHEKIYPVYGLAEATLLVSGKKTHPTYNVIWVEPNQYSHDQIQSIQHTTQKHKIGLVSCGKVVDDLDVVIVDTDTKRICEDNQIGEICIHGPSVTAGYWKKDKASKETFQFQPRGSDKHYLRTGDLGFISQGELYITGRLKDMMIINGKNYYPQDFEHLVEKISEKIRVGSIAAFHIPHHDEEGMVIVAGVKRNENLAQLKEKIREEIYNHFHITPYDIQLVPPKIIPKTTSGKIKRQKIKKDYLNQRLAS